MHDLIDTSAVVAPHPVAAQLLRETCNGADRFSAPLVAVVAIGDLQILGGRQVGVGVALGQVGQPLWVSHGYGEPQREPAHHRGLVPWEALVGVGLGGRAELRLYHDGVVVEVEQDVRLSARLPERVALLSLRVQPLVTKEPGKGKETTNRSSLSSITVYSGIRPERMLLSPSMIGTPSPRRSMTRERPRCWSAGIGQRASKETINSFLLYCLRGMLSVVSVLGRVHGT